MKNLLIIVLLVLFSSCMGTKKTSEITSVTKQTEKLEVKSDSSSIKETNKAIHDEASFKPPESNTGDIEYDRRVNEGIVNALRGMDFSKTSGDNSYRFWYDINEKLIKMQATIGETSNVATDTNKSEKSEKTFEQTVIENTKKVVKMIPWWLWIAIVYFARKHIINIIAVFVPGVRGIRTINDLLNPASKKE